MPTANAITSTTIRLEPPLDRPPSEALQREGGVWVELEGRRARLNPDDARSAGFAQVLDGLSKLGRPVYVEVDPATDAVTRVLVPAVGRVVSVTAAENALDVELDASHGRHMLRLDEPDSAELEQRLRDAVKEGRPMIVVEDDAHNIIDVRAFTPAPDVPLPPFPPIPFPKPPLLLWPLRLLRWIWWVISWPWWWWHCPSGTRAQQIFDAMAATTCNPLTIPPPCIPFLYPDDGCWARAHEMCRLMIDMGLSPRKVWIDHSAGHWLHVNTKNNPQCYVEWGWHVAPTICVRGPMFFSTTRMVIDPSLFTTPVSKATWKGVQGDPGAALTDTGPEQFWHGGGTDPNYADSNAILATYRLALQTRSIQVGPPPYANCP
ncbi:MAG: protein-glutamine glutaminase family protein [Actinomycetota bacterium]|nr:protein-glutamine glutaminase family protein [Actinomycetota bacterium]